jgi:hypothetical protein
LLFVIANSASAQKCASLQGVSPDELTSYLATNARSPDKESCGAFAINQLGIMGYKPAIPALTKWLELRWPPGAHQKQRRFVVEANGATIYPAAAALEAMGKDSLPAVLDAITSNSATRESVEVAVSVWMTTYTDHPVIGVTLLKQEADRTTDAEAKSRLRWAALKAAVGWCSVSEREQCRAALGTP